MTATTRIGVILTYDNAIDPELWRWCPPDVSLHIARTGYPDEDESVRDSNEQVSDPAQLRFATRSLIFLEPAVVTFACTSGSFHGGLAWERSIRETMLAAGAGRAQTTSGALLEAIDVLGIRRLAVGTPYDRGSTDRLGTFLAEAGITAVSLEHQPPRPGDDLNDFSEADLEGLAERAMRPDADALFLSCTALATIDLIPQLERRYGVPVLTSTQVTMWAALRAAGARTAVADQTLFAAAGGAAGVSTSAG